MCTFIFYCSSINSVIFRVPIRTIPLFLLHFIFHIFNAFDCLEGWSQHYTITACMGRECVQASAGIKGI